MFNLLSAPRATMERVQEYITRTMLRLYRQRNLVLHGGKTETESVTLQAALRTAAPLVGAGFDRIVHAWLEHSVEPLDLAAKAQARLWCLESSVSTHLTDLLE